VRWGAGEPSYGTVYGRTSKLIDTQLSTLMHPNCIAVNLDHSAISNSQGTLQMLLALDSAPSEFLSPNTGAGTASNADSTGKTTAMLTGAPDIRVAKCISIEEGSIASLIAKCRLQ